MAGQNAQQAGLAGTVPAEQSYLFSRGNGERDRFQQSLVAVSQGQIVGGQ